MLLAIDTATQNISLALHDGAEVCFEQTWRSSNQHSVELAPAVVAALRRTDESKLSAMAVAIGPGTYTGLRVGVSFAKGFAAARNLPLVGVTTLDILAAAHPPVASELITVVQAGRGRVVAGLYQWVDDQWMLQNEPQATDWEMLLMNIQSPVAITGEIDADARERLTYAIGLGMPIAVAPAATRLRRAGFLAEEAWRRLGASTDDRRFESAQVVPVYVKTKDSP